MAKKRRQTSARSLADELGASSTPDNILERAGESVRSASVEVAVKQLESMDEKSKSEILERMGVSVVSRKLISLQSGKEVYFNLVELSGRSEIESKTRVHSLNGRDELTAHAVSDITPTIKQGQLYDAYGVLSDDGVIEVLDGSRRRKAAILEDAHFKIYVAEEPITLSDAKYISDLAKLSKSLSAREKGFQYQSIMEREGIETQKDLSAHLGLSEAAITRCINASEISNDLLSLYPDPNGLNLKTYTDLRGIEKKLEERKYSLKEFCEYCRMATDDLHGKEHFSDEKNTLITKEVKIVFDSLQNEKKKSEKPVTIKSFNKNQHIKKRVVGDVVRFEFKRISKDKLEKVQKYINTLFDE